MIQYRKPEILTALFVFLSTFLFSQIERVEPPNWWVGMQNPKLQLLVKGNKAGQLEPKINYKGISIKEIHQADSENYLFIDLEIAPDAKAGDFTIAFQRDGATVEEWKYSLLPRQRQASDIQGFDASDVIYLITPDRFANGDPSNDIVEGTLETTINRREGFARHGGDIQGIIDHLDYLADMGFTAIWPSPLLENDMPKWSYHGYAITDYYQVDPRFGSNELYIELAEKARERGIKLIFDAVANHCGSYHWWMEDLPFDDWLNFQQADSTVVTNHRRTVNQDPHAAEADRKLMAGGWFVPTMPDLNQKNPFMAEYIIQNNIWWVETLALGGIRQDTYPYPDKDFLSEWTCRIMAEYPNFSIVGEEWSTNPAIAAYWQQGKINPDGYTSCLRSPMDFPLQEALVNALTTEESWDGGLVLLYNALANDFIYAEPMDIMTFGDNHDMNRLFTWLGEDEELTKMAIAYLLTIRGIPQVYYGTEVLLENTGYPGDHGVIRTDFPGGWPGDVVNGFTGKGLSPIQKEVQDMMKKLLDWRKTQTALHNGKTLHFAPKDGAYVYFRYNDDSKVMVVLNKNDGEAHLDIARFAEIMRGDKIGMDVLTGKRVMLSKGITVPARSALILQIE